MDALGTLPFSGIAEGTGVLGAILGKGWSNVWRFNLFVYFVRNGKRGAIKIGETKDVQKRIAELQIGNPTKLVLIAQIPCDSVAQAKAIEGKLHRFFKKQRIRGEWFAGNINLNKIRGL